MVTVSEDLLLRAIWMGSFILAGASVAVMLILVIRRSLIEKRIRHIHERRQMLSRYLYAALKSPVLVSAEHLPPIYKDDYPGLTAMALDMLRVLKDAESIVAVLHLWRLETYLYEVIRTGGRGKRVQALTLLGYFSDDESAAALLSCINESDMYVQIAALRALVMRDAQAYTQNILASLLHAKQTTNTRLLQDILQRLGEPAVPAIQELASSSSNSHVRVAAVIALGMIGAPAATDSLIELMNDPDSDVRAQSIAALGKLGGRGAGAAIAVHLADEVPAVRIQAVQALGLLHIDACLPQLLSLLNDTHWWVRYRSAEALCRFGNKGLAALRMISTQKNSAGLLAQQVLGEQKERNI